MADSDTTAQPALNKEPSAAGEAAAREKEAAEQAALPYKWTQTIAELDVTVPIPGNLRARDLVVDIKKQSLKVAVKGQEPIIDVSVFVPLLRYVSPQK